MMNKFKSVTQGILNWLEHGDLVPLIVLVSALHYSVILQAHDHIITATAIGFMVDLGHFRTVRAAVRYAPIKTRAKQKQNAHRREYVTRWGMAIFMTAVSIAYQERFYNDLWFSLPLPFLIIALAWLQQKDQRTQRTTVQVKHVKVKPVKDVKHTKFDSHLQDMNAARAAQKQVRLLELADIYRDDPDAQPKDVAEKMGVTRQTVYNLKKELNGHTPAAVRPAGDG